MKDIKMKRFILLVILFSPALILGIMGRDNILGMVISVNLFWSIIPLILLSEGINPRTSILVEKSQFKKIIKDSSAKIANKIFRILLIITSLLCLWLYSIPIYSDTYDLAIENKVKNGDFTITNRSSLLGIFGLLVQYVHIQNEDNIEYKYYFSPKHRLKVNEKYNLIILPHSRIILDAKPVKK
jgi:hypothetical protein